ncbi:MAG: IPT/TIG domain-containing protein [Myxococcota bacterium]
MVADAEFPRPDAVVDAAAHADESAEPEAYVDVPLHVIGLSPGRGDTGGGLEVRIRGAGLYGVVEVRFGATLAAGWRTESDREGFVITPPHPAGVVDVVVRDVDGAEVRLESAFVYEEPVVISAIEPSTGSVRGGEPVRLTGVGFGADAVVTIGGRRALSVALGPDGSLTALTPEGAQGPADVFVRSGDGLGSLTAGFSYYAAPALRSVSPVAGPRWAATPVVLLGEGFTDDAAVSAGGLALLDVVVVSATRIEAVVPALEGPGGAVTGDVVVTVDAGEAELSGAFTWLPTVAGEPTVHAVVPGFGAIGGGEVVSVVTSGFADLSDAVTVFGEVEAGQSVAAAGADVLSVRVPAAAGASVVDVNVSAGSESAVLAGAYEFRASPRIVEVLPNLGAAAGGTAIVVRGEGFTPEARLSLGPLAAATLEYVDATTLRATTPPGSPGMATVRVEQAGGGDALASGFHFVDVPSLDAMSPPAGSVSGGTLIRVHGAGFVPGTTVAIGGKLARDVNVLGPTLLEARTLSGEPGRADVTLSVPGQAPVVAKSLWLYFDPAAEDGFWGPAIHRNLDVTVYDRVSGQRVEGAVVVVGPVPKTPIRGYTNSAGQITFGRAELSGPQTVTANKEGFAVTSVVGVNASHIALGIDRIPQCSDLSDDVQCSPPPAQSGTLDGSASGGSKGVKIPWGRCDTATTNPGGLCGACTTDADCGGRPCVDIPGQGRYCTVGCSGPADCPTGYGCYSLGGDIGLACVPSGGELRVYCDVTNRYTSSQDAIPYPGVLVGPDGRFKTPTRLGDYAVFCWSGIYADGKFTPERLGVARHQGAYQEGDVVVADLQLNHVMRSDISVVLDRPALGSPFSESAELRTFLDLGGDGVLELPPSAALGRGELSPRLVPALTGDLADASYTFIAVVSSTETPQGYSVIIRKDVTEVDSDRALRLGDAGFEIRPGLPTAVRAMVPVDGALLAVGDRGLITRNTGGDWWFVQASGTTRALHGVSAVAGGAAIAVGEAGLALHYDGLVWRAVPTGDDSETLRGVWMAAEDRAWAVGGTRLLAWDGSSWQLEDSLSAEVNAITGRADADGTSLFLAGANGLFARRTADGALTTVATGTQATLRAVWATPGGAVWAVGASGTALRIDGEIVTATPVPTYRTLRAVWGDASGAIWVAGDFGTLARWDGEAWTDESVRDFTSTLYAISGVAGNTWALGAHELALGPMLGLPEQFTMAEGSDLFHEMSWKTDSTHPAQLVVATVDDTSGPCAACGAYYLLPYDQRSIYARGDVNRIRYPDFTGIYGASEPQSAGRTLTIYRAWLRDDFDFDSAKNNELQAGGWTAYSVLQPTMQPSTLISF